MQTRTVDLMELFVQLFDTNGATEQEPAGSTLEPPMAELSAPPVALSELLSADGSVVSKVLEDQAGKVPPELAGKFAELAKLLAAADQGVGDGYDSTDGLPDFVYPVV